MNGFGPADFPGTPAASKPAAAAFSLFAKSAGITAHFVDSGKAILAVHEALTTLGKDRGIAAQTTIGTSLADRCRCLPQPALLLTIARANNGQGDGNALESRTQAE
jgi:hypothetical protein